VQIHQVIQHLLHFTILQSCAANLAYVRALIIVCAALVGLGVLLAVVLERVAVLLELVPGVARRGAELLHLVPRRRALAGDLLVRARLLRLLDAVRHLVGDPRRRRRPARPHGEAAAARHGEPDAAGDLPPRDHVGGREGRRGGEASHHRRHLQQLAATNFLCGFGVAFTCCHEETVRGVAAFWRSVWGLYIYIALFVEGSGLSYRLRATRCGTRPLRWRIEDI
jgi:hypothetical protein